METANPKVLHLLERLEAELPVIMRWFDNDAMVLAAFDIEANDIRTTASEGERAYVEGRLNCMLKNAHLIPGEDEGEPCSQP